ncbi:putative glutamine synthetase protein [Oceanicola granulosus HTCC2516]|uniref:Putative glutamine synthetase protein n=1 Tax=Oceanicola granulosus (strain ATCC BAA-861 / DSM 15982 / KCTC 12143 / HTCC2516) TaxID=314256 RepID=Q2CEU5_OCEGH|nr:glutamine synthetase family protein [Oceanicola granulosus]EAR51163.1 putative glutamine synthetase protein [Oceanicola granulosus HTCC2516]
MSHPEEPLVFVATTDLSGLLRGKAFPVSAWDRRARRGVGWTPTNVQITCFDNIADSPFGALGDLVLVPDAESRIALPAADGRPAIDLALGDIRSLEGKPWDYCTRSLAKRALAALEQEAGLSLVGAFEHEFQLPDVPPRTGDSFGYRGFRDAQGWAQQLLGAMKAARLGPDTFMKEYGPSQFEVTAEPAQGVRIADVSALTKMLVHEVTGRAGLAATFAPIIDPESVGNGVHLHMSFLDADGRPATYDAEAPHGMSEATRHFIGGILAHLDQILALLAPSDISYLRLTPHRWSAAYNNLGYRDREASVRICPVTSQDEASVARQYNFEVRAIDAAASPHLVLAALVFAGVEGLRGRIEPPDVTQEDLSELAPETLAARGFARLPQSLPEALARMEGSEAVRRWFGPDFVQVYADHKRAELSMLDGLDDAEKCARYRDVY